MNLSETSAIPVFDLPMQAFRDHLRVGTGFSDDTLQDNLLEAVLRSALAAIEARTGKVLMSRNFRWALSAWRSREVQALPVAPVTALNGIQLVSRSGDATLFDLGCVELVEDDQRPVLKTSCRLLPPIPPGGAIEISFTAGYATTWEELPADLRQAVLILAAYFYENRGDAMINDGNMPLAVTVLTEKYRTVRILGGSPR